MVSHGSLSSSKSLQVARILLSIVADNTVVCMVSTRPLISKYSSPCTNSLVTVSLASITICITVTFVFHSYFNSLARSKYLPFFSRSLNFSLSSAKPAKFSILWDLFFFFFFFLIVWPRLSDPFVSQNASGFYASHSPRQILSFWIYHLFTW